MEEYFQIINKIAIALKTLEGNRHTFGLYLPTLFGLQNILKKNANITTTETLECFELAKALDAAFERRFGQLMDINDPEGRSAPLYIAMLTNPQFKLNFMGSKTIQPNVLRQLKEMLVSAAIQIEQSKSSSRLGEKSNDNNCTAAIERKCKLYFFKFLVTELFFVFEYDHFFLRLVSKPNGLCELLVENDVTQSLGSMWDDRERIIKQIDGYLCTKTTPNIEEGLKNFPVIRELFEKFNCIRSTEAICERMFSYAGNRQFLKS